MESKKRYLILTSNSLKHHPNIGTIFVAMPSEVYERLKKISTLMSKANSLFLDNLGIHPTHLDFLLQGSDAVRCAGVHSGLCNPYALPLDKDEVDQILGNDKEVACTLELSDAELDAFIHPRDNTIIQDPMFSISESCESGLLMWAVVSGELTTINVYLPEE